MYEQLVYRAEPSRKRRVRGNAEGDRFPIHRPARRDDEISERNEAPRVDRRLGEHERRQAKCDDRRSLLGRSWEDDRLHGGIRPQP